MTYQRRLTWPSERDLERLNAIIFETEINPFSIASYNPNEPVTDFVGRREELLKLKAQIQIVLNNKISRSVKLSGPGGVGKSTLFNFLKESIERERIDRDPSTDYILKNCDVLSTYFQIPDKINGFQDIWKPMMEGLRPGFEREIGYDISFPEYITFQIIYRLFKNDNETLAPIIWKESEMPRRLYQMELRDIIEPLFSQGASAVHALQEYYKENKRKIRNFLQIKIKGRTYQLKRFDNKILLNLFRVIDEDDPDDYLELILDADSEIFNTNDDLIEYFNNLMRYYACCVKKQPILLIGIDEAVKADPREYNEYFQNLGNLFVKLRNSLNDVLFVFISTTEDWGEFDNVIKNYTDLQSQLSEYMYKMVLTQLSVDEMTEVFKNRMNRFWLNYSSERPPEARYYPFTENLFRYVYRYKLRDLRETIHFLKEIWMKFKYTHFIPKFETIFESMREIRKYEKNSFIPQSISKFEWNIINDSFNNPSRFQDSNSRSIAVEKGLEYAWKCLLFENPQTITRVENNCTIKTSSGNRRPDIFIEVMGNMGAELRRNIEFQIKAYNPESTVSYDKIKSSLELFNEQFTDFIYFLITGRGLEPIAEAKIKDLEMTYPNRIRRPKLTKEKKNRLYLLALFEEITGNRLNGQNLEDLQIAKDLLGFIIGQSVEEFLAEIKRLAYRPPRLEGVEIEPPEVEPEQPLTPQTTITHFGTYNSQDDEYKEESIEKIKWLEDYPDIHPYRFEAVALCDYLKDRESGRYKYKFTISTVEKNVILPDASLKKNLFRSLVKHLESNNYTEKVKSSYKLTELGEIFYQAVKAEKYKC